MRRYGRRWEAHGHCGRRHARGRGRSGRGSVRQVSLNTRPLLSCWIVLIIFAVAGVIVVVVGLCRARIGVGLQAIAGGLGGLALCSSALAILEAAEAGGPLLGRLVVALVPELAAVERKLALDAGRAPGNATIAPGTRRSVLGRGRSRSRRRGGGHPLELALATLGARDGLALLARALGVGRAAGRGLEGGWERRVVRARGRRRRGRGGCCRRRRAGAHGPAAAAATLSWPASVAGTGTCEAEGPGRGGGGRSGADEMEEVAW